ncbi:hypothetical protein BaRGS_00019042 [Batillaria attramentaria]|uniref:Uncharacterized protein n=1 Tax=Batillaria attramentaria TaxID=370345 RepID=A0ABD0KQV6_9CAEN
MRSLILRQSSTVNGSCGEERELNGRILFFRLKEVRHYSMTRDCLTHSRVGIGAVRARSGVGGIGADTSVSMIETVTVCEVKGNTFFLLRQC